jgi:catalase (peroxidase I)
MLAKPQSKCLASTGRRDAATPDPTGRLPEESLSAEALRLNFAAKGMSAKELVALSGAHTVRKSGA